MGRRFSGRGFIFIKLLSLLKTYTVSLDRFPVVMDLHSVRGIHRVASYHGVLTKSGAAYGRMPEAALLVERPLCFNYHSLFSSSSERSDFFTVFV